MKSIRSKLLFMICTTMIGIYLLLAGTGIYYIQNMIETSFSQEMTMLVRQSADELNVHFEGVERAVHTLDDYICKHVDLQELKTDADYTQAFMDEIRVRCADTARVTGNVVAIYFRPVPEEYGSTAGIFLTDDGNGDYVSVPPTDILEFQPDDREHVGWYYEPIKEHKAIWMEPYANKNINIYMISYVAPMYVDGELLGVVGMDINMAQIHSMVESIDYKGGFGFLIDDDGDLVYHKAYPEGRKGILLDDELGAAVHFLQSDEAKDCGIGSYTWHGKRQRLIGDSLGNGMMLAISVPEAEIMRPHIVMRRNMLFILAVMLIVTIFLVWRILVGIVKPIRTLTEAASRIAKGEWNAPITYTSKNEIGELSDSIRLMSKELQSYFEHIQAQAYTDAMTGVGNKTAYLEKVRRMERKIEEGMAEFSVIVFDINGLKRVNDERGHEYGDLLINETGSVLKLVFGAACVYRIGGDEFISVLENTDESDIALYFRKFSKAIAEVHDESDEHALTLAVSKGSAVYDRQTDTDYQSVFKRADSDMYRDKEAYYRGRNDRRRER